MSNTTMKTWPGGVRDLLRIAEKRAAAFERELCAEVAEGHPDDKRSKDYWEGRAEAAATIRALEVEP